MTRIGYFSLTLDGYFNPTLIEGDAKDRLRKWDNVNYLAQMFEKPHSTKGEHHGNELYWARKLIEEHSDMYHEIQIKNGNVIQKLELEYR